MKDVPPDVHDPSVFSVADQQISDSLKHMSAFNRAFKLPALSMVSEENDCHVNMFNKVSELVNFVVFMYYNLHQPC